MNCKLSNSRPRAAIKLRAKLENISIQERKLVVIFLIEEIEAQKAFTKMISQGLHHQLKLCQQFRRNH